MNQEQVKSLLRYGIGFVGGILVGRGSIKAETVQALLSNEAVLGAIASAVATGWGLLARTNKNLVVAAATVPEVKEIVATKALANDVPSTKVVSS